MKHVVTVHLYAFNVLHYALNDVTFAEKKTVYKHVIVVLIITNCKHLSQ